MKTIQIHAGTQTPFVHFDASNGNLEISGRSIAEQLGLFYQPLIDWIDDYIAIAQPLTILNIDFEYFNTGTAKYILEIMKKMEYIALRGHEVFINWFYSEGDSDMLEAGEDYQSIIKLPVKLICKG